MNPTSIKIGNGAKFLIGSIITVIIALILLIVLFNSFTIVSPGNYGVQYSLSGGVKNEVLEEGLNWHSPMVNVEEMPKSKRTVVLAVPTQEGEPNDSFSVNTADGKSVNVDATYAFSFEKKSVPHIFVQFQRADADTIARTYIKQQLKGSVQAVTTTYSVTEVYGGEKRNEITAKVQKIFEERMLKDGIIVQDFTFQDVRVDDKTKEQIQRIVDAKNQEEFLKQDYKNKQQEAQNKQLAAETDKKVAIINAEKNAEVAKKEAEGRAAANQKLQQTLTPLLIQKQWIEAWEKGGSQVPQYMMGNDTNMMMQLPTKP